MTNVSHRILSQLPFRAVLLWWFLPLPARRGQLLADWFTVQAGGTGDFLTFCSSDFRTDLVLSNLGPNGLPVYNMLSVGHSRTGPTVHPDLDNAR